MKNKITDLKILLFFFALLLEGLDAFSILDIPITWIGIFIYVLIFIFLKLQGSLGIQFDLAFIRYFLFYLALVTLIRSLTFDMNMPEFATTTFIQYISLRLLKIISFYSVLAIAIYIIKIKNLEYFLTIIAYIGIFISLLSLYSYISYIFDWSDFSRSRPGTGGWTQPIKRACSILRNYGTFREPSFLAVWIVPIIPIYFYLARTNKKWYFISLFPLLSLVLTRSLTGVISIILVFAVVLVIDLFRNRKLNKFLILPILFIFMLSIISNNLSYRFPALDSSMCPPESQDKCDCSIYDDELDKVKNSNSITQSIFQRIALISSGGIDAFENIDILSEYLTLENFKFFGDGLGVSNIKYSQKYLEITKQVKEGEIIYRNPGQIVSFNNLYGNLYLSSGFFGLLFFLLILKSIFLKLIKNLDNLDLYLLAGFLALLLMFLFQAEELSSQLAIYFAIIIQKSYK